ncbi:MAG: TetR/AcrR family transcriptional regulator [Zoogloeaceae bacterium]|jgi:AcrR family transcriptional regulator|nr:TetR/AcrR family transcriptional regulator [Zoogloeaceae bacterium]
MPAAGERNDKELAVLSAATRVFLEHGFSAATTDMIQREAGISKATMYACFHCKEALFIAVVERECAVMTQAFEAIQMSSSGIASTLADLGATYLRIVLSPTLMALFRLVIAEAPRFPELGRRFYRAGPSVVCEKVAACLTDAARNKEIDIQSIGAGAAAALFLSMLRGEAQLECLTHPDTQPSAAQMDHWVQTAVTAFLAAFGVWRDFPPVNSEP